MRLLQSLALIIITTSAVQAQRLVKLNLLEKSPLANMVVYSMNDSTANYTKLVAGTGIQITYNENDTTLTITATGTSVGVPQTLSLDDGTRVLSISDGNSVDLSESIQEEVNAMLVAGDNVTLTYNDVANTLTIASTGGVGGATNIGDLGDVTITSATTGQVLKYDGAEWINAVDSGIALTDLSVTTNAAGSAALTYNNTNGVFSFTPPDLSSYLTSAQLANLTDIDTAGLADQYILKYNSSTQEWEVKENNIDGLTDASFDGQNNLLIATSKIIPNIAGSENNGNIGIGFAVFDSLKYGNENLGIAIGVAVNADTLIRSIGIGKNSMGGYTHTQGIYHTKATESVYFGLFSGGMDSLSFRSTQIGTLTNKGDGTKNRINRNGVLIGYAAQSLQDNSVFETAIGANVTGNGDSTATIGQTFLKGTYLNGTMNFNGYGLGNKEAADLSKTGSGYFLEVATDGTLIESTVTGGTAQTLSFDDATRELSISSGNTVDLSEGIQDEIAATITAGTGITVTYDDGAGTLEIAAPAGSGNTDEQTLSINEGTAELTISNGNTVDLSELIDEQVNTLLTAGDNIALTYNDVANTLTISASGDITNIDQIDFNTNTADAVEGRLQYDTEFGTLVFGLNNDTPLHIGSDMGWYVKNQTGSDIAKGTPVYASGTDGSSGRITVTPMIADGSINAKYFLGVTAEAIVNGADGFVWTHGKIRGINLSGYSAGDVLYVSSASAGAFANTSPSAPNLKLPVGFVVNNTSNGTLAVRSTIGTYISESHDVQIASAANGEVLKFDGSKWVDGTDLVDDADADPNNEIQTITASNGLTATATGDDYDIKLGGTLSDATTTIDMNDNALTFTNNGSFTLSGDGGVSFTNTSATDYSSVLSLAGTNTRIYADGGTTEPLNSINLTSSRSGVKEMDIRSSVSNDNGTYTLIALNPTRLSIKTPNVTDVTAQNGQFLKLVDRLTGEVEFADALTTEVDGSVTNEIQDLSLTGNTLSLSSDATTVDLSPYLDDQTVTLTGGGITAISGTYPNFTITSTEVDGSVTNEIQDLSLTGNVLSLSGDATTVDLSTYLDESTTASNGLTLSGTNVKLGGTLTEITNIAMGGFNASIFDVTSSTGLAIQPSINEVIMYGTQSFTDYGSGNKEAGDLSKTFSGHYAGFATDGTVIEVNALPITSGTSATIDWGNMPQRIHVLDFGFNTILTLAFSNVLVGGIYTLRVTGNAGTDTLIWPAAAKFEDGSSVGIVTLQNGGQMFTFYWDGTNYWVK